MNNKELISAIAIKLNLPKQEVEQLLDITVSVCSTQLIEENTIGILSFGKFEVKNREERILVHPSTQIKTLIPPKLVVNFKQSNILKEKLKGIPHYD